MSTAWEITQDDIATVLIQHNRFDRETLGLATDEVDNQIGRVERAVLYYTKFEDQVNSMLDEIENVLIETHILTGEKLFSMSQE